MPTAPFLPLHCIHIRISTSCPHNIPIPTKVFISNTKMADSEFEEFKRYFDKLPQYIKAPNHCYTLLPNINLLEDETPTTPVRSYEDGILSGEANGGDGCDGIREPFSGDLQLIVPENVDAGSPVRRKRRKLPEIPKSGRKWLNDDSQISLAQELINADKEDRGGSYSGSSNRWPFNHRALGDTQTQSTENSYGIERPVFVLRFNNRGIQDDESSSDSEKYPSLDSGHSTNHSDDGSKPYSPQITSINESFSPSPSLTGVPFPHLEILDATHRGLHKFIPRHRDEIHLDIGDPIYMQKEADDLWCEGVNLRTGMQGVFPSAYVVDVEYNDFDPSANKLKQERYLINYIGSVETLYHKGNEVLCQAVKKISGLENYVASHTRPCILEISDQGIRMVDKGKIVGNQTACYDYFYALKNVSFCGFHPNDHRYFGFVTKHPTLNRFACHVFISDSTTRPVAEAVGRAFQRFYQKFLETAYPIEDIYLE